ncbi:MAG TPA: hypothetical protein PK987_04525 [Ferruginibacter sp.]|nr:hypothetical protein [Ferruginibacter sp.]
MKTILSGTHTTYGNVHLHHHHNKLDNLITWINEHEPTWEFYRFGIGAAGIFIQVTFAALMIGTLGMAGASPWVFGIGIFLAFAANSAVFAQSPMYIIIGAILLSIVTNLLLALCYGIPMLLS